jgi:HPt (histidine-containing phosphotransfer) domain-containing protein
VAASGRPVQTPNALDGQDFAATEELRQYMAASGESARLKVALARGDFPALATVAHTLKGESSAVGARELAELCGELQRCSQECERTQAMALVAALEPTFQRALVALVNEARSRC